MGAMRARWYVWGTSSLFVFILGARRDKKDPVRTSYACVFAREHGTFFMFCSFQFFRFHLSIFISSLLFSDPERSCVNNSCKRPVTMKSGFFLVAPVLVTVFNLWFAIFLNERHAHATAFTTPSHQDQMRRLQRGIRNRLLD